MSDEVLRERIRSVTIVARAVPEQKLRIVNALKANEEVVAMTGDGVNDAPALRAADIGIAMGGRGTDVAREAADLIVTDDNFASIVQAVRLGRRIFNNLKKATGYIVAVHIPIAGIALLPAVFGWPLVLLPAHIAFLELIIDPACSVVFEAEPEGPDVMRRPPRSRHESLYSRAALRQSLVDGLSVLVCVLLVYLVTRSFGYDDDQVRTLTFTILVLGNLALILSNRSRSRGLAATIRTRNPALWWVVGGTMIGLPRCARRSVSKICIQVLPAWHGRSGAVRCNRRRAAPLAGTAQPMDSPSQCHVVTPGAPLSERQRARTQRRPEKNGFVVASSSGKLLGETFLLVTHKFAVTLAIRGLIVAGLAADGVIRRQVAGRQVGR